MTDPTPDNPARPDPPAARSSAKSAAATDRGNGRAVLVLAFGGPEGPEDVLPFLRNVTTGRGVPDERLAEVAEQYQLFGGRSPLNDQMRALVAALGPALHERGIPLPVYWGNRNWRPHLADTVAAMAADGITEAAVFATSAYGSYSGCRQYRDDLAAARDAVGPGAPALHKLRLFYNHPGFVDPMADALRVGFGAEPGTRGPVTLERGTRLVASAHSIPTAMATGCDYPRQLAETTRLVVERAELVDADGRAAPADLVFQSRSGPPAVPWLEPDINDHLRVLADQGVDRVVNLPVGFISDHMEVVFDLDTQAARNAAGLGLKWSRVPTVGTDPRFVAMIADLVAERFLDAPRLAVGRDGPWPDECPADHCPAPVRRPR
ncbi:MAG: ferrochelatase [Acidimicrobiales bacterium]